MEEQQYAYPDEWDTSHIGHFWWADYSNISNALSEEVPTTTEFDKGVAFFGNFDEKMNLDDNNSNNVLNCIRPNRNMAMAVSKWFTLTSSQWKYLLGISSAEEMITNSIKLNRAAYDAVEANYKYPVTVSGVEYCLVLAPTDYTGAIADSYTDSTWSDAECDGLVCIPAAGYRVYDSEAGAPSIYSGEIESGNVKIGSSAQFAWASDYETSSNRSTESISHAAPNAASSGTVTPYPYAVGCNTRDSTTSFYVNQTGPTNRFARPVRLACWDAESVVN